MNLWSLLPPENGAGESCRVSHGTQEDLQKLRHPREVLGNVPSHGIHLKKDLRKSHLGLPHRRHSEVVHSTRLFSYEQVRLLLIIWSVPQESWLNVSPCK